LVNRITPGFCQYWKESEPFHSRSCWKNSGELPILLQSVYTISLTLKL